MDEHCRKKNAVPKAVLKIHVALFIFRVHLNLFRILLDICELLLVSQYGKIILSFASVLSAPLYGQKKNARDKFAYEVFLWIY